VKCGQCGEDVLSDTYKYGGSVCCYWCLHEKANIIEALEAELGIIMVDNSKAKDVKNGMLEAYGMEDMIDER
jgi:hypothetical protein